MGTESASSSLQRLEPQIEAMACGTGYDVQALIEGAKAITDSFDMGSDERPYQVIRLLTKAQEGVQQLQDMLDMIGMNIRRSSESKN